MAELLYRLGRFSARHAWPVIISWIVILGLAVGSFLAFGGTLSTSFSIPGTETSKVTDRLADKMPSASGATGTVVFHSEDGDALSKSQQSEIGSLLEDTEGRNGVDSTTDPFATQDERQSNADDVEDGKKKIDDGLTDLDDGQDQLDDGFDRIDQAQEQLDTARSQTDDPAALAQLDSQQQELDAQKDGLETKQETLDENKTDLKDKSDDLDDAEDLLDMSSDVRMVSDDNSTALGSIVFDASQDDIDSDTKTDTIDYISDNLPDEVDAEFSSDLAQEIPEILGVGELIGLIIAAITLLIMLRAVVAAALPILSALVGVGTGVTASLALSGSIDMVSVTPVLGVMLGLAVGIDYSLFILNRHRRQLREGTELHESIGLANGTSGNAVVFAGATVLIALLALNLTGIGFLGMMGTVGAICVAVSILIAITMTPAMLSLIGLRALGRKDRDRIGTQSHESSTLKPMKTSRAVITLICGLAVLIIVAIPALSMRMALPDGTSEPVDSTQYKAYEMVEDNFGEGANSPLLVVADLSEAADDDDIASEQVSIGQRLQAEDNVSGVAPIGASDDNTVLAFQVIPEDGPSSESTERLVHDLRGLSPLDDGTSIGVAGTSSGNIDVSETLADSLPLYLGVVIGLSLIIMILVFRSILVPLTATVGFILSLFATFGGLTAIFQWGWLGGVFGVHDPAPIMSFLPTVIIGILFGLSMDYQLFLVSGMREAYAHGTPARIAVQRGVRSGRTVVIAAAIIMVSVFGGFIFSNSAIISSLGFALAFGVLVDAFIVRLLLIPAAMHLLGKWAWWIPRWLDRIMPDVDVEGSALEERHNSQPTPLDSGIHESKELVEHTHAIAPVQETSMYEPTPTVYIAPSGSNSEVKTETEDLVLAVHEQENGRRSISVGSYMVFVDSNCRTVIEPPSGGAVVVEGSRR